MSCTPLSVGFRDPASTRPRWHVTLPPGRAPSATSSRPMRSSIMTRPRLDLSPRRADRPDQFDPHRPAQCLRARAGDGGPDGRGLRQALGGYPRHHIARANALAGRWPAWMSAGRVGPAGRPWRSRARMLGAPSASPVSGGGSTQLASLSPVVLERLTGSAPREVSAPDGGERALIVDRDPAASMSRYDQRRYLHHLLDPMNRMTMATVSEPRSPVSRTCAGWSSSRLPYRCWPCGAWQQRCSSSNSRKASWSRIDSRAEVRVRCPGG